MPVFRNVNPNHQSERLGNQTPVIYDVDAWPSSESINYLPNGGTSDGSVFQSYSHSRQQERRPSDEQYQSSANSTSCLPSPRESHSRRREPGHIPRPRNAFIIFRSHYISGRTSSGEGQQNELSKQAGKVWNRMTEDEKSPFVASARSEKEQHQAMYPNYTYCPGRGVARRKGRPVTKNTKNTSGPKRKTSAVAVAFSESIFPEIPFAASAQRPSRVAAERAVQRFLQPHLISSSPCPTSPTPEESPMLECLELTYPEPDSPAENVFAPTIDSGTLKLDIPVEEGTFVRTVGTPILEPSPIKKEEPEPRFDLTMRPPHLYRIPEQFGFKYYSDSTAMLAHLPPMPNTDDETACSGDVPSLFSQLSRPPINLPAVRVTDDDPSFFSSNGNITDQSTIHYSETPRMHVPGFTWSYYHDGSIVSEDMRLKEDMTFMGSFFNFEAS